MNRLMLFRFQALCRKTAKLLAMGECEGGRRRYGKKCGTCDTKGKETFPCGSSLSQVICSSPNKNLWQCHRSHVIHIVPLPAMANGPASTAGKRKSDTPFSRLWQVPVFPLHSIHGYSPYGILSDTFPGISCASPYPAETPRLTLTSFVLHHQNWLWPANIYNCYVIRKYLQKVLHQYNSMEVSSHCKPASPSGGTYAYETSCPSHVP